MDVQIGESRQAGAIRQIDHGTCLRVCLTRTQHSDTAIAHHHDVRSQYLAAAGIEQTAALKGQIGCRAGERDTAQGGGQSADQNGGAAHGDDLGRKSRDPSILRRFGHKPGRNMVRCGKL
jgi:hypothetical protein